MANDPSISGKRRKKRNSVIKMTTLLKLSLWLALSIGSALVLRGWLTDADLNGAQLLSLSVASINLEYTTNTGINFGIAGEATFSRQLLLAIMAVVICLLVIYWGVRSKTKWSAFIAGLFAGGGLANAFERLVYGGVFDYLNISMTFYDNPYSFNLADIYIFLALVLYIVRPESVKRVEK